MSSPAVRYRVALAGFSEFERTALASFFRLAAQRQPTYVQVQTAEQSDFLIADADLREAVEAVQAVGRIADTVFVGAHAPVDAMAWLTRPIDPIHIVRELDLLVAMRAGHGAGGVPLRQPDVDLLLHDVPEPRPAPSSGTTAWTPSIGMAARDVLVVEDSAIARKFLTLRLQRYGYRVYVAHHGEEAIELVSQQTFAIAFIDVMLGPPGSVDGLRVCQYIKHRQAQSEQGATTAVVLVTGLAGPTDRVRGSLAGCDAYLVKPLLEASFVATLQSIDPMLRVPLGR